MLVLREEEVKENAGICLPNFQSAQVFRGLMHKEILKLKQPATILLDNARTIIQHVVVSVIRQNFSMYPALLSRVNNQSTNFLDLRINIIMDRLEELLMEEEEIYTVNHYYMDTAAKRHNIDIQERLYQIQQNAIQQQQGKQGNSSSGGASPPSTLTLSVNDLTITVHLGELIKHAEKQEKASGKIVAGAPASAPASSIVNGLQALISGASASILELQVNAFAYTQIMHKRVCDQLPLMIRFHLLRTLTQSPATPTALVNLNRIIKCPTYEFK